MLSEQRFEATAIFCCKRCSYRYFIDGKFRGKSLTQISKNKFPDNRKFAFTILDDTDLSTIDNVGPIYQLLAELGMRTTKSVWPLASVPEGRQGGDSLQEADYLRFVLDLQTQ